MSASRTASYSHADIDYLVMSFKWNFPRSAAHCEEDSLMWLIYLNFIEETIFLLFYFKSYIKWRILNLFGKINFCDGKKLKQKARENNFVKNKKHV